MNPGFVTNPNKWKAKYTVEYIDDPTVWDLLCRDYYENPWEAYKVKEFDNASEAMELFTIYRVNRSRIYDCKLFMRVETPDGNWYEEFIDTSGTYRNTMNNLANREMNQRIDMLEKENESLVEVNKKLIDYLQKYNVNINKILNG
jgi:hypothetical protein